MDFYGIFKICWRRNHLDTPAIRFHEMATEYVAYLSIYRHCWSLDWNQEDQWLIAIVCLNMLREDIVQRCAVTMPAARHALADAFLHPLPEKSKSKVSVLVAPSDYAKVHRSSLCICFILKQLLAYLLDGRCSWSSTESRARPSFRNILIKDLVSHVVQISNF